ncbi:MAG: FIMAH domain-containing protein [bacterium]
MRALLDHLVDGGRLDADLAGTLEALLDNAERQAEAGRPHVARTLLGLAGQLAALYGQLGLVPPDVAAALVEEFDQLQP